MSEGYGDTDGPADCIPPRVSRGRRSGVILPGVGGGGPDSDTILLEAVKAAPRRSSIIKVQNSQPDFVCNCHANCLCWTHFVKKKSMSKSCQHNIVLLSKFGRVCSVLSWFGSKTGVNVLHLRPPRIIQVFLKTTKHLKFIEFQPCWLICYIFKT